MAPGQSTDSLESQPQVTTLEPNHGQHHTRSTAATRRSANSLNHTTEADPTQPSDNSSGQHTSLSQSLVNQQLLSLGSTEC